MRLDIYSERGEGGGESHGVGRRSFSPQVLQKESVREAGRRAGGSQQTSDLVWRTPGSLGGGSPHQGGVSLGFLMAVCITLEVRVLEEVGQSRWYSVWD